MPSAEHFSDLIDSCVNQVEDGFSKPPGAGLQLTATDEQRLLSFYQQSDPDTPLWHIGFTKQQTDLHITALADAQSLSHAGTVNNQAANVTLCSKGQVGINTNAPQHSLDVHGIIASQGRVGSQLLEEKIPADGQWHDLTPKLEGCQMFEVVAGIGIKHSGRYALLHAIAINTCAPNHYWWHWRSKNPINTQHAYFHSTADKLQLRWKHTTQQGTERPYTLQIRTNTSYGEHHYIRYHLTKLWHDPYMLECEHQQEVEKA